MNYSYHIEVIVVAVIIQPFFGTFLVTIIIGKLILEHDCECNSCAKYYFISICKIVMWSIVRLKQH